MKITLRDVLDVPYEEALKAIVEFTKSFVESAGASKVVIGLSGGLDSSTLLVLLLRALPRSRVVALIMPDTRATPEEDVEDAVSLAKSYGVEHYLIYIDDIVNSYAKAPFIDIKEDLATGNLRARIRMNLLYYYANKYNAIVAGSSDRSELLIGYYTKYGDGAADFYPIGCLYKTQVRELARRLGLPENIVSKPSAPRLYKDHTAFQELGLTYEEVDLALYALFDLKLSIEEAVEATGLPRSTIEKVLQLHRKSRHKRATPPVAPLPWLPQPVYEI
ncbi:MAG: NAD+ synthase [Desulfurococcaceae archaeon]